MTSLCYLLIALRSFFLVGKKWIFYLTSELQTTYFSHDINTARIFSSYLIHRFIQCEELIQQGIWLIFTQHRGFLTTRLLCEPSSLWNYIGLDVSLMDLAGLTVYHMSMWGLFISKQHFEGIWKHMFLNIQTYLIKIFNNLKLKCGPHL